MIGSVMLNYGQQRCGRKQTGVRKENEEIDVKLG